MVDSIHAARWAKQFDPNEVEFTLFPSGPNRRVHQIFKDLKLPIVPFGGLLSVPLWGADRIFDDRIRAFLLRRAIRRINPDFIHALEFQHAGYVASKALEDRRINTTFIATNYGSDIYWFQQFPKHLAKIKKTLARADRYSAECNRDVELAEKYGFSGDVMPVIPNAGGMSGEILTTSLIPPSQRKIIAVKGYEGWVGRASVAVEALYFLATDLADFKIVFFSCNLRTIRNLKKAKQVTGLDINWYAKGALTHRQILDLFSKSKIYIGLSLSDGISTSLLESMAMGAFPIQTNTSCSSEWISELSGISVDKITAENVSRIVRDVLSNKRDLEIAQTLNLEVIQTKASYDFVKSLSKKFYAD
jgi:hypothetical protein